VDVALGGGFLCLLRSMFAVGNNQRVWGVFLDTDADTKQAFRNLNSVVVPAFVGVPKNSAEEEGKSK
jgi:hypothetical protein